MHSYPDPVLWKTPFTEVAPIIGYGFTKLDECDRHAYFVDRILRGAKPADLPFEQTQPRLAINVEAARLKGITFPQSILTMADWAVPPQPLIDLTTTRRRMTRKTRKGWKAIGPSCDPCVSPGGRACQ
jgi:hypothetical protein